jgi:NAD+ synthase (glutamine-hydrolysing)
MDGSKIAIAQINTSVGSIEYNTDRIIEYIEKAKASSAVLVVFSEMTVPGYPPKDLLLSDEFVRSCEYAQERIRKASKGMAVVVGGIERVDGELFNTAFVFNDGNTVYKYHKMHLPNYDVFDEKRYFSSGNSDGMFELFGKKFAINICEDIWVEGGQADKQAEKGAELIINISSSPFHYSKTLERQELISKHISRGHVPIIYANQVGGQDDLIFDGESYAFNGKGEMIAQAKHFREDMIVFSTNSAPVTPKNQTSAEEVYNALVLGVRDFVHKNGFKKVVLGLSGGVDSALVAAIAADALLPENVLCVMMPSRFSSDHSINDSKALVKNLGVASEIISIEPAFKAFTKMLSPIFKDTKPGTAEENIQARIRMVNLYGIANKFGYMVLNTSNKSEAAVGYGTIYGDMAGDLSVIGDVPKMMVYDLCRYINGVAGYDRIPRNILTKEPSAELKANQRDRDSLPEYAILDNVIHKYVEEIQSPEKIKESGTDPSVLKELVRKIDGAENKRHRAPPAIKVTPKAFGTGRRMPIANGYKHKVAQ